MNRKTKIIVSVVGITIVTLALLGITYAYYLTRIEGNTNTNSISVTTADLKLTYGDGNGLLAANDIMPGTTLTKEFTVTNEGESRVENYVVVLESVVNKLTRKQDLTYTLECKLENESSCGSTELEDEKGPLFPNDGVDKAIFLNSIDKDVTHYYKLVVTYANPNEDQSIDMGKTFSALVNIRDSKGMDITGLTNPSDSTKLLADAIINNAKSNKNGTTYREIPLTEPAKQSSSIYTYSVSDSLTTRTISSGKEFLYGDDIDVSSGRFKLVNPKVTTDITSIKGKYVTSTYGSDSGYYENSWSYMLDEDYIHYALYKVGNATTSTSLQYANVTIRETASAESTLSITEDNMGDGISYYFRGNVQDNYVLFNNMCFRIVRIEGDKSIKLVYAGEVSAGATNCNEVGDDTGVLYNTNGSIFYVRYGDAYDTENYFYANYINYTYNEDRQYWSGDGKGLREELHKWYESKFNTDALKAKLKTDKWCLGYNLDYVYNEMTGERIYTDRPYDDYYYYDVSKRLEIDHVSSIKCENNYYDEAKIGVLDADELVLAGINPNVKNTTYYLFDNVKTESYLTLSVVQYQPMDGQSFVYYISNGSLDTTPVTNTSGIRPSITLIPGTTITGGEGTKTNPYIIN